MYFGRTRLRLCDAEIGETVRGIVPVPDVKIRPQSDFLRRDGAPMIRITAVVPLVTLLAMTVPASAQSAADRHNSGCARDVARHCRAKMNDGDMVVLACLKEHRSKLSKACLKTLAEHGQ